ncbi:MFS transporter [Variovorax sp. RA8]|uniref:MFS transporter n=1 Tax=Variovorax sp. (strain JCM 16519 / RA8) TaxID=662548 RepID=UPI001317CF00|nr:MFS transporter [Variovorax sp. RA8]VTU16662.1 Inner membrane transport protein YnfM [Variovorax sp. RA8]
MPFTSPSIRRREGPPSSGGHASRTLLFSVAVGIVVLGLFASQALLPALSQSMHLRPGTSGLMTTLTLLGYAGGLFFLVPLTDVAESRSLILGMLTLDVLALGALGALGTTSSVPLFLAACFASGVSASAVQMLVPMAAALSPQRQRGEVVGKLMSGLMLGILLSRPMASLTAQALGWRWFYGGLAAAVGVLALVLWRSLPALAPAGKLPYPRLIISMWALLRQEPVVRRRAVSQALCMAAFSMFWTSIVLRLGQAPFHLGNTGVAVFALSGAGGVIVAPLAGRAGDRGWTRPATFLAQAVIVGALALAAFADGTQAHHARAMLLLLGVASVLLDMGVIAEQALGRRAVNMLQPEARGRLNGLFTGIFFVGAAAGASLSGPAWVLGGWLGVCACGVVFGLIALIVTAMPIGGGDAGPGDRHASNPGWSLAPRQLLVGTTQRTDDNLASVERLCLRTSHSRH